MADLRDLKQSIELMSHHHQIEVLRILCSRKNVHLNENQNGTFINMSSLSQDDIVSLKEYSDYVKDQQSTLALIESKKQFIQNKYFNSNKDNSVEYVSEC
jgi:hypothetical protein